MDNIFEKIGISKDGIIKFVTREEARAHLRKTAQRPADTADVQIKNPERKDSDNNARSCRLVDELVNSLWTRTAD